MNAGAAWRPGALHWCLPYAIFAALLVWLMGAGGDAWLTAQFWDPQTRSFPWRHDETLKLWLHTSVKPPVVALGIATLLALIASFGNNRLRPYHKLLAYCVLSMVLGSGVISLLKSGSCQSCPYDLLEYGGKNPHIGLFDAIPIGAVLGKCWPGAHAATAFSLFGYYFAARTLGWQRRAQAVLAFIVVFGLVLSLTQVARGAHFLSHQVWTAAIDWTIAIGLHRCFFRQS
jgi:membrane-associated PAP2 superfamily phosphatase